MRDLEFRIWDKKDKLFLYAEVIFGFFPLLPTECESDKKLFAERFSDPMQYTEVKDKNEKKIYEGDVVQYDWDCGEKRLQKVYWSHAGFYPFYDDESCIDETECIVVGNIYENPELLSEVTNERN